MIRLKHNCNSPVLTITCHSKEQEIALCEKHLYTFFKSENYCDGCLDLHIFKILMFSDSIFAVTCNHVHLTSNELINFRKKLKKNHT